MDKAAAGVRETVRESAGAARWAGSRYWRAIILGLLLVPVNIYFLMYMEVATNQGIAGTGGGPYPSTISLFANTILFLVVLTVLNAQFAAMAPAGRAGAGRSCW